MSANQISEEMMRTGKEWHEKTCGSGVQKQITRNKARIDPDHACGSCSSMATMDMHQQNRPVRKWSGPGRSGPQKTERSGPKKNITKHGETGANER